MTISIKVHVNGNYQATISHHVEDEGEQPQVVVGPGEEKTVNFRHGKKNVFEITEEYLGDKSKVE